MKYNFDEIIDRKNTYALKWDAGPHAHKLGIDIPWNDDTIPLMVADMDFACPPAIIDKMHEVASNRIYGYSSNVIVPEYYDAVINWHKRRYNIDINEDEIIYSSGTLVAIQHAIRTFSNIGDGVIISRPVYSNFTKSIEEVTYRKVVSSDLINDGHGYYTMDWEDFENKCKDPNNRIYILCSPANPIGRVWTKDELRKIVEITQKHNVLLFSDEIHAEIVRKNETHHTIYNIADNYDNIIMVTGLNKCFNIAGLSCSNVIIKNRELREIFKKDFHSASPTPFAIGATIAGYNDSEEWLDELNLYLDSLVDWSIDYFKKYLPSLKIFKPEGTYILWLDFSNYNLTYKEIHKKIYLDANVVLTDGTSYDPDNGHQFQRLCLTSPKSVLKTAFDRIIDEFKHLEK